MITLTLSVPDNAAIMAAGFVKIRGYRHTGAPAGLQVQVVPDIVLQPNTTSYTLVDPQGNYGDWFTTTYVNGANAESTQSTPQPGYLSDVLTTVRDLLGVSTTEVSDTQIQGISYLPAAFGHVRQRCPTFDTLVAAAGTDASSLALGGLAHYTAGLLCNRMKVQVVDMERIKDYQYQRNRAMDWDATREALMAQAEMLLSEALGETVLDANVYATPLALAGPTRSGVNTSGGLVPMPTTGLENPLAPFMGNFNPNN